MKSFNLSVPEKEIQGDPKGKKLFAVVWVEIESRTELWSANNEDELKELLGEVFSDGDSGYEPGVDGPDINEEFGVTVIAKEIGEISSSLEIPLPILHLANALKPYGISTGEVKKDQEFDGFYITNAPNSPHLFQMCYNLDPDWGPTGFQIFSEDGKDDIYFGDNAVVALKSIVKYLEKI
jgi:hypothetical protein